MAITDISFYQDNKFAGSNLLPIHSPLVFVIDVIYDTITPDVLKVGIYDDTNTLLDTFNLIPYEDISATNRRFVFIANEVMKGLLPKFDDQLQNIDQLIYIDNITKTLRLRFYDPDVPATYAEDTFTFIHGSKQFSERPNLDPIFNNESDTYYALKDSFVYAYWYNDDTTNLVYAGSVNPTLEADPLILDFGNEVINGTYQTYEFILNGYNLTQDVVLTFPTHFVGAHTDNGPDYLSEMTISPVNGMIINKTIYVAFRPLAVVSYDENLAIEWEGTTIDVQLLGAGDAA